MVPPAFALGCRFGPFELDFRSLELRRNGRRVRLQEKPLRILIALAERPGEVITRAELRERLWSQDTFVAFEDGLNTAVRKLRETLGDDPQTPRYIETVRGRGYRLMMDTRPIGAENGALPVELSPSPANGFAHSGALMEETAQPARASLSSQSVHGFNGNGSALATEGESARQAVAPVSARKHHWALYACVAVIVACGGLAAAWWFLPVPELHAIHIAQLTTNSNIDFQVKPVTDGGRVFYLERAGGHWNLMETSLKGGVPQPVEGVGENTRVMDISPDHETFLLGRFTSRGSQSSLWLMPVQGGAPVRLANIDSGEAVWTPDGGHIVYAKDHELWIVGVDGNGARPFAGLPGSPNWLVWSPDGTRLRFSISDDSGNSALWELRRDGSQLHRVLSKNEAPGEGQCCGEWTPDGHYFVFTVSANRHSNLWILREPGFGLRRMPQNPVQLTDWPAGAWGAHVTPDGRSVLFYSGRSRSQIIRFDRKTNESVPISAEGFSQPDYSPDGKWLVYVDVNNGMLWKAAADGSARFPLSLPGFETVFPRWSPDGTRIVVSGSTPGAATNVFLISASGGQPELLLPNQRSYDADWAPDGKSLVVVHSLAGQPDRRALFLVDVATRSETMVPGSADHFFPHWSRDGRYIEAYEDERPGVAIYDFTTHQWTELVRGTIGYPQWSHDGRYLYYQKILEENEPVFRFDPKTHVTERVADCKLELGTGVSRCAFLGLSPDDSPLFDITRGTNDLYSAELTLP
jgi:Tol biopolymer transport system component/DNA-binding winged helix-turn-helix (wHTH) protein